MFHRQGRWEPRDLNELRKVVPGYLTPDLCFLITTSWLKSKQTKYRERRDLCLTENSFKVMILCFLRLSEWWCQRERNRREDKGYGFNFCIFNFCRMRIDMYGSLTFNESWNHGNSWRKKKENEVTQSCLTLWDCMDLISPPGFSIHGIF